MKKIGVIFLVLALAIGLFSGCGSSTTTGTSDAETSSAVSAESASAEVSSSGMAKEDITLAGIVFSPQQNMTLMSMGYQAAADDYGVKIMLANSQQDQTTETDLINTYIQQGVDGIAICPLSEDASVPALKVAAEAGIKVVITNMSLNEETSGFITGGFTSSDHDNAYKVATAIAPWLKENMTDIKLGIVQYDSFLPEQSSARWQGFTDGLDDAGVTYTVVFNQSPDLNDYTSSIAAMVLANPDVNLYYANNETWITTVVQTLIEKNITTAKVIGYDMGEQMADYLADPSSPLIATIEQDMYQMGYNAVELLVKALTGEDVSDQAGTTQYVEGTVYTQEDQEALQAWIENFDSIFGDDES